MIWYEPGFLGTTCIACVIKWHIITWNLTQTFHNIIYYTPGVVESQSKAMRKKLEGSLAPLSVTWWTSCFGLLCLVHSAFSWQDGIRRPGSKLSTSFLVICKNCQLSYGSNQKLYHPYRWVDQWKYSPFIFKSNSFKWDAIWFKLNWQVWTNHGMLGCVLLLDFL